MKPTLKLNISDEDRSLVAQCLKIVHDGMVDRGSSAPGLVKSLNDLRFTVEMEEEIEDGKSAALLYTTIEQAIPGVVQPDHREALKRVLEVINRDGEAMMKRFRKSRH